MAVKTMMPVDEYLHTRFEGSDCEYLDGEIVERNMGEIPHGDIQMELSFRLRSLVPALDLRVIPEIRIQISPARYRVADVAVWTPSANIGTRIPTRPPFLVAEILSAEDRMGRVVPKVQEYLGIGVGTIWVIDPAERNVITYSRNNPIGYVSELLICEDPSIQISLADILPAEN